MYIFEVRGQTPKRQRGSTWLRRPGTRLRMNANSAPIVLDGELKELFANVPMIAVSSSFSMHFQKYQSIQTTKTRSILPFSCCLRVCARHLIEIK